MAKLNVKVLDMQNGEITKVAYEGAEYAKVESNALIGDLALCVNETPFFTVGEFYLAWDLYENGEPRMKDDADDNYQMRQGTYVLFRKISADKPTLEQRVETLESDVAALKGEKEASSILAVGERVYTSGSSKWGRDCDGKTGTIEENDLNNGHYYVQLDDGRGVYLKPTQVKKFEETIEFEGATYCKVEREAREGDVVISNAKSSSFVTKGKPYKVTSSDGDLILNGGTSHAIDLYNVGRTRETVDVYEPIEQAKYVPKEGDIVVITGNTSSHTNSIGDIGKVGKEEPLDDGGVKVYVPGGPLCAIRTKPCDIRKATPAEVEKYEQAMKDANKPKLKAGDYVKITRELSHYDNNGAYEIVEKNGNLGVIDEDGDFNSGAITAGEYEIVDAETAKWAKIGRKPNEFKKGDVVRVLGVCSGHEIAGQLGEIVIADGTDQPSVRAVYNDELIELWTRVELVAPVESLFNA